MIWSLGETLKFIEAYLPGQLVSPQAFSHVQTIANLLPEAMSAHYFECRLAAKTHQLDFATCVMASKGGREILAGHNATADLPPILLQHPLWRRVREFFRCWADPTSPLYEQVPLIWLGFDQVDGRLPKVPLPCLSFSLNPEHLGRHPSSQPSHHAHTQPYLQFAETTFAGLLGHPLSPQTRQNLQACFDLLPAGGQISYLSAMLSRQPAALKVNGFVPKDQLLAYLTQIGWTGSLAELEQIMATFCTFTDKIKFDLTVGPTISARFSLEFFSKGLSQSDSQRQFFLNQLVDEGLCTPEKRQALLAWFGFSSEVFSHQSWPTRLSRSWYAKIVYQPHQPLEAKGYLGFVPSLFSLFTLT